MDQAKEVRKGEALDWNKLEAHLKLALPELQGPMLVKQFHGGHANLTYLIKFGDQELVLRRPPFGKIAPGAHSMSREYRVLSRLYKYFPPAPKAWYFSDDESIIGAPFIIMERRHGLIIRNKIVPEFERMDDIEKRVTKAMIKAQADLHTIDVEANDLMHLGKPEGFLERQIAGWTKRWNFAKTESDPNMEKVMERLEANIPKTQRVSIIHNDIKFDNCQFQPDNPDEMSAIFDWDMTTLGDPLADFAVSLSYWPEPRLQQFKDLPVTLSGNFPSKDFLKAEYQALTGLDLAPITWYEAFAYCKAAIIAQQLYKRYVDGQTQDQRMKGFGKSAKVLAWLANEI